MWACAAHPVGRLEVFVAGGLAGAPVSTDGPFAEIKESLAGYWIVEASEERAIEIASRVVAYTEYPMEVRQIMNESTRLDQ